MEKKCPKCGWVRAEKDGFPESECPRCGIIYEKYEKYVLKKKEDDAAEQYAADKEIRAGTKEIVSDMSDVLKESIQENVRENLLWPLSLELAQFVGVSLGLNFLAMKLLTSFNTFVRANLPLIFFVCSLLAAVSLTFLIKKIVKIKRYLDKIIERSGLATGAILGVTVYALYIMFVWMPEGPDEDKMREAEAKGREMSRKSATENQLAVVASQFYIYLAENQFQVAGLDEMRQALGLSRGDLNDGWGTPIRLEQKEPLILRSAGSDMIFNTPDDIVRQSH